MDIDGAIERGTYRSFDADVAPDPVRFLEAIDGVREAATNAGKADPRVAFCGERAGRLWAAGRTAEAAQLEELCSELAQDIDILCAYPVPYTNDDQALTRIRAEHNGRFCLLDAQIGDDVRPHGGGGRAIVRNDNEAGLHSHRPRAMRCRDWCGRAVGRQRDGPAARLHPKSTQCTGAGRGVHSRRRLGHVRRRGCGKARHGCARDYRR